MIAALINQTEYTEICSAEGKGLHEQLCGFKDMQLEHKHKIKDSPKCDFHCYILNLHTN